MGQSALRDRKVPFWTLTGLRSCTGARRSPERRPATRAGNRTSPPNGRRRTLSRMSRTTCQERKPPSGAAPSQRDDRVRRAPAASWTRVGRPRRCRAALVAARATRSRRLSARWPSSRVAEQAGATRRQAPTRSKGNRVNIPEPGGGDRALGPQCGNATELGDASVDPGKSSLFFVRSGLPGIGLSSDRDVASVKRRASRGVRCVGAGPWKSEEGSVIFSPGRTRIRSRSPRWTASGR